MCKVLAMKHDALGMMLIEYLGLPERITKATISLRAGEPTVVIYDYIKSFDANEHGELDTVTETLTFQHWYEPEQ